LHYKIQAFITREELAEEYVMIYETNIILTIYRFTRAEAFLAQHPELANELANLNSNTLDGYLNTLQQAGSLEDFEAFFRAETGYARPTKQQIYNRAMTKTQLFFREDHPWGQFQVQYLTF
jgi:hypothetical protein